MYSYITGTIDEDNYKDFDCAQILSFPRTYLTEKNNNLTFHIDGLINQGFIVLFDNCMRKLKKSVCKHKDDDFQIELFNQCYLGEFDDWVELKTPPESIQMLHDNIIQFCLDNHIHEISLWLIDYYFEDENTPDDIKHFESNRHDFIEKLFSRSWHNPDEGIFAKNICINLKLNI